MLKLRKIFGALVLVLAASSGFAQTWKQVGSVPPDGVVGAACTPTGAIAKDSSGATLSCQSGVWYRQGGNATACYIFSAGGRMGNHGTPIVSLTGTWIGVGSDSGSTFTGNIGCAYSSPQCMFQYQGYVNIGMNPYNSPILVVNVPISSRVPCP